jgi:cell wall-associated NlpC family hydrolase
MDTAKKISAETGVPWQVLLAIPGNETGWGKAMVGNNYFGIKGKSKSGASSGQVGTWEVVNGQKVNINDEFRAYGGYEESARDFVDFLHENPRYNSALAYLQKQPDDWRGFIREVHAQGYATDPEWSNKIVNIGNGIGDDATPAVMTPGQKNRLPADKSGRLGVQSVIDVGSTAIGSKYVWGGAGGRTNFDPNFVGSDCSGFVSWAYQQATGKKLTAFTGSIWDETTSVDAKDAAPGDLVMYNMDTKDPHMQHVGIYAGNGQMLHDSSINPNGGVDITPLWKGVQFRRVPGVDSNLANYSTRDAGRDPPAADDNLQDWYITVHGGRQMFIGTTAAGNTITDDLGPAPQGTRAGQVLSFSDQFGAGQNTGDETYVQSEGLAMQRIGAGADERDPRLQQRLGGTPSVGSSLIDLVQPDIGKPYKMAAGRENGMSANPEDHPAYDCSSFVSSVAARQGYKLSPFTDRMHDETVPVKPGEETAGDLIFYQYKDPEQRGVVFPHVGFYLGDGRTLEARWDQATGGRVDEYDQLDPKIFKPVYRRMAKPEVGTGQDEEDYSFLDTPLSTQGEARFQIWKAQHAPKDSGWDYDLRGAFKAGIKPDPESGHWPDTYKKPNHPTFSNQSKYAQDYADKAGHWDGDRYVPPGDPGLRQHLGGMGAGQDDDILDPNTLDRMRREEEERQVELARQEQENRAREDEARRQEQINEVNRPFELPASPTAIRNVPDQPPPGREGLQQAEQGVQGNLDRLGQELDRPVQDTLGDLAGAAGSMIGGAASAIGTTVRGAADALAAVPDAARATEQARDEEQAAAIARVQAEDEARRQQTGPPIAEGTVQQNVDDIGTALGNIRDTVGTVFSPVGDYAARYRDWLNEPTPVQPPRASEGQLGRDAWSAVQSPEFQAGVTVGQNIIGALNPMTAGKTIAPGMQAIIDWNKANGFEGMMNTPAPPPVELPSSHEPGSIQARAAAGQQLNPAEQLKLIHEGYEAAEEMRRESIRAAMPPEIRDSPEGIATVEAITMATDATNFIPTELGVGASTKVGRKLLLEGAETSIKRASPEGAAAIARAIEGTEQATPSVAAAVRQIEGLTDEAAALAAKRTPQRVAPVAAAIDDTAKAVTEAPTTGVPVGTPEEVATAARASSSTAKAADYLAAEAAMKGSPEEIAFGNLVAEAVDRPYSAKEQLELLQSAALHLNDPIIEADAKALKEMVASGQKVEPLTGEQIRRRIINGVGRSAEILEPEYTPEWILSETDKIMDAAGHPLLKSDAVASRVPSPSEILDARLGWWETEASRRAHAYDEQRKITFAAMDRYKQHDTLRQIREATQAMFPTALKGLVGAAAGAAHEYATTPGDQEVDLPKAVLKAGVAGFATAIGAGPAIGLVGKGLNGVVLKNATEIFAPVMNFSKPVKDATFQWAGDLELAHNLSKQLKSEWIRTFGEKISVEEQAGFEINGRFSDDLMRLPGAQDAIDHWVAVATWAKDQGLIARPIEMHGTHGTPKVYIPHILQKDLDDGYRMAGENKNRGMLARNPMRYFEQARQYFTMYDGMFQPHYGTPKFTYSEDMAENLGNYYERTIQAAAHRLYVKRLHEVSLSRTPELLDGADLKPDDLIRVTDPRNFPKNGVKLNGIKGFDFFPELEDVYVSENMKDALTTMMGGGRGVRDIPVIGDTLMDMNAMFKLNVLSGIDAYHILNETRQLFATQGWNAVVGGKGAGLQVATGLVGAAAGVGQELAQEQPNYATAAVKGAIGFGLGTAATAPIKVALPFGAKVGTPGTLLPKDMQGGGTLWMAFAHALDPSLHQKWLRDPVTAKRIQRSIRDGMQMTIVPDLPEHLSIKQRFLLAGMNTVSGGVGAYQATLMSGGSEEEAIKAGLIGGAAGLALSSPLPIGKEQRSIVETIANRTFDQLIPYMKYTTYEMYAPKVGGRAAAEFANEVYGGQNILAIGRSRLVQDAMRLAILAPDWQEGWARLVGNGLFNWGADAPQGKMARIYWRNALVQSAVLLEGTNLAMNGTWSWQNDPNGTLMVNASRFYDMMGWNRTNPRTGEQYQPHWDILGPYRGMLEPAVESSRWAMAGAYQGLGFKPERIPAYAETVGRLPRVGMTEDAIPRPHNVKDAWASFLSARGGVLGSAGQEIMTGKDFAGNPIDRADDDMYHQTSNRILNFMLNMLPTGQAEFSRAIAQGEEPTVAAGSILTGSRPRRIDSATEHFQAIEEIKRETRTSDEAYRTQRQGDFTHNQKIDTTIANILSGRTNKGSDDPLGSGQKSDATPTDRKNRVAALGADRRSMRERLYDMAAQVEGPERAVAEQIIQAQQEMEVVPGKAVPADMDLVRRPDLDPEELFRLAWNRDPTQVAWLKGEQPQSQDLLGKIHDGLREVLGRAPGGKDKEQQLQDLRTRWTIKTATEWGIDPAVMNDMVKARVYEIGAPPPIPGVTSEQLDDLTDQYQAAGRDHQGKAITDPTMAAIYQQEYLLKTAGELGVDPKNLAQRIKLRTLPADDSTPQALSYSHARDVLSDARLYKYQFSDGEPYGTPTDWAKWDEELSKKQSQWDFQEKDGYRVYITPGNKGVDRRLTTIYEAKQYALANKYKDVRQSPHAEDFYRWYGDGVNFTDEQWTRYKAGTLDMWRDKPDTREAQNRNEATRVWASLTPDERNRYGLPAHGYQPIEWTAYLPSGRTEKRKTSLANYINYINGWKTKEWLGKLGDIDPDTGETVSSEDR